MTDNGFPGDPVLATAEADQSTNLQAEDVLQEAIGGEDNPITNITMDAIIERGKQLEKEMARDAQSQPKTATEPRKEPPLAQPGRKKSKQKGMLIPILDEESLPSRVGDAHEEIVKAAPALPTSSLKAAAASPTTPRAAQPATAPPENDSEISPGSGEWHDVPSTGDHALMTPDADHDQLYGDVDPLASIASSYAQDLRRDLDEVAARVAQIQTTSSQMTLNMEGIKTAIEEIKASNNQFQTNILDRLRALERTLAHDPPHVQKSSAVADAVRKTENKDNDRSVSTPSSSTISFAERLRAKKGER